LARNIHNWLEALGFEAFVDVFDDNQVDLDAARDLTEIDLKELGVPLGPRKKLLRAISNLRNPPADAPRGLAMVAPAQQLGVAESRQVTLLYCELVGPTELSRPLSPEEGLDVVRRYRDAVEEETTHYGGRVVKYQGCGVLAYFDWPQAYEDQAEHAVRGGLDVITATRLVKIAAGGRLQARVGIATGLVGARDLTGETGREVQAITGETPIMAVRLQAIADPGQVIVCAETRRLVGDAFDLRDLETPQVLRSGLVRLAPGVSIAASLQETPLAHRKDAESGTPDPRRVGLPER